MKISIGADHGAFELKSSLVEALKAEGHTIIDQGSFSKESVDYPDYAQLVANDILEDQAEAGILCCTTGIGMSISANKIPGIRAALCSHTDEAALTRQHNKSNILCMGALHTTPHQALRLAKTFVASEFEGGRHERRVNKFSAWEKSSCSQ